MEKLGKGCVNRVNDLSLPLTKYVELGRDYMLSHLSRLQCAYSFSKYTNEVFSVQGAWDFPHALPTIVPCQVFRTITWKPTIKRDSLSATLGGDEQLCGFYPCNPSPVPNPSSTD